MSAQEHTLPIPIIFEGVLVPAGTVVTLWPDQIVRVEAAARLAAADDPSANSRDPDDGAGEAPLRSTLSRSSEETNA